MTDRRDGSMITDGPRNGYHGSGPRTLGGWAIEEGVPRAPLLKRAGAEC